MKERTNALVGFIVTALALGMGVVIGANIPELHSDSCKTAVRSTDVMIDGIRSTFKTMLTATAAEKKVTEASLEQARQDYMANRDACLGGR